MAIDCLTKIISRPVRGTPVARKQHVRETGLSGNIIAMNRPPNPARLGSLGGPVMEPPIALLSLSFETLNLTRPV